MNKDLLSMEEMGKLVGLTVNKAFNLATQERLELYPIGKTICVDGKDVIEMLVMKQRLDRKALERKMADIIKERREKLKKESQ